MKKFKWNGHRPNTISVPIELVTLEDSSFHLIVNVEIDGIRGDMIIDTGASVTVIDQELFPEKMSHPENTAKIQSGSVNGQIEEVTMLQADYLKIGGRKLKEIQLAGIDLTYVNNMYHQHLNRKIIGLLGCDFCVRYQATIDYSRQKFTLNIPPKSKIKC